MTAGVASKENEPGHVIVSFDVYSPAPIQELVDHMTESAKPAGQYRYSFGTTSFDERKSGPRAEKLETTIDTYIDHLGAVPRELLHAPQTFVRLFITLPSGAATLQARTVQRLAKVNATVWIDA